LISACRAASMINALLATNMPHLPSMQIGLIGPSNCETSLCSNVMSARKSKTVSFQC
jgi:hypothetical protein